MPETPRFLRLDERRQSARARAGEIVDLEHVVEQDRRLAPLFQLEAHPVRLHRQRPAHLEIAVGEPKSEGSWADRPACLEFGQFRDEQQAFRRDFEVPERRLPEQRRRISAPGQQGAVIEPEQLKLAPGAAFPTLCRGTKRQNQEPGSYRGPASCPARPLL